MNLDIYRRWADREQGLARQVAAVVFGAAIFVVGIPLLLVTVLPSLDARIGLPRLRDGFINPVLALALMAPGLWLAGWSVATQLLWGKGTPVPVVPTRRLLRQGPYSLCRNPMVLGTAMSYLGIAAWRGFLSAAGATFLLVGALLAYVKCVEEKELELRFGQHYLDYKQRTPFLLPRLLTLFRSMFK